MCSLLVMCSLLGYMFFVSYVFFVRLCSLLVLCYLLGYVFFVSLSILSVMYVPFCLIVLFCVLFVCKCVLYYCHRDIGHFSTNLTEVFPYFFLSCKANARL
jgi:hypothetical protein